jgi:aminopeptidase N
MTRITLILTGLLLSLFAEAQVTHSCPVHLPENGGYENPLNAKWLSAYDVKYCELQLEVSNTTTVISGTATLLMEAVREMDTVVLELQDALEVLSVELGEGIGDPGAVPVTQFSHADDAVFIPLDRSYNQGEMLAVQVEYQGEAGQNRGFFAGITSKVDPIYGFEVTYTLSEPMNAKDWFPVKQVLGDQIDSVDMYIECNNNLMAGSNGTLEEVVPGSNNTHIFHWHTNYPTAYYLISFTVADYQDLSFNAPLSTEGDSVLVQNFIYNTDRVLADWEEEIRTTGPLISLYSGLLIDYPFADEKYGHCLAPLGGGMEHQTMTTLTDFGFFLVAHELAHQWFGDYVTCANWQDIWINEGFASYMEYVSAQHLLDQENARGWMENAMTYALAETEGSVYVPAEEVEDTYRLFDMGLSYKKGAILLHMIRYLLDDDALFFGALRSYLGQYGDSLATAEDFREVLESYTGMDFSCFFEQWYYGEGYPRFQVQWSQAGDSLMIMSEQTATAPLVTPFYMTPFDLEIRYTGGNSERMRLVQEATVVDTTIQVSGTIEEIVFDPDLWLLKTVSVLNVIPEYGEEKQFVIGPNPVISELRIRFLNNTKIDRIVVTNMAGQEVWSKEDVENPVRLDLSGLTAGSYLLVMYDADRTYREKFVKIDP